MRRIYLDNNATTRIAPSVRAAMLSAIDDGWGNPSSVHEDGRRARDLVERARDEVAALLAGAREEIVFTSGGTEADNLAVLGAARAMRARTGRDRVVSSPLEHPAVRGALEVLAREGFTVALAPVDAEGRIAPREVARLVDERTALVTLALANHELGNLYPVEEFARVAHEAGALAHTDAVQAAGKLPVDVKRLGVDLASVSAHKFGGPPGVGAVWERGGALVEPIVVGGHQERERRAGTENVVGIVGMGAACAVARDELLPAAASVAQRRDRLEAGLLGVAGARRFGGGPRVCNTTNVGFAGVEGELVVVNLDLDGISASTGAACTSGSVAPSPVILALGVPREVAATATRFSLAPHNTDEEIDAVLDRIPALVGRVRRLR